MTCTSCSKTINLREEKETDVAVGVKRLEILHDDLADRVVLVTGDTDIAPAVRAADRMFPNREVCFAFRGAEKTTSWRAAPNAAFRSLARRTFDTSSPIR